MSWELERLLLQDNTPTPWYEAEQTLHFWEDRVATIGNEGLTSIVLAHAIPASQALPIHRYHFRFHWVFGNSDHDPLRRVESDAPIFVLDGMIEFLVHRFGYHYMEADSHSDSLTADTDTSPTTSEVNL